MPPMRRRCSFGLRALLVLMTLAGVLSAIAATYRHEWAHRSQVQVIGPGSIRQDDVDAICRVIAASTKVKNKNIGFLCPEMFGPDTAQVSTRIPGRFEGEIIALDKQGGTWAIIHVEQWP